ncbi:MAG: zinc-dependent peptidase [Verrucomicrobiales bacterium]|jgi:Mlc titration factor MtfA (ptsG expression regulator)|nr:zinc-dependent peptidase [Verrucomicrobiales bacterium]MBP9224038.1 zinc-dependent peptidase [Verrucomicrobiales bacterium]
MKTPGALFWSEIVFGLLVISAVVYWIGKRVRERRRRLLRLSTPFSPDEEVILSRDVPRYRALPANVRTRFAGFTRVLMEEKNYEACGGLAEVTEKMKLVISAQAAILLLELPRHGFYPRLRSILVYPGAFRDAGRRQFDLPEESTRGSLLGESWPTGSIILSWDSVLAGGRSCDDGMNVVIHEFAHQLDQANGAADGIPALRNRRAYVAWGEVFEREYQTLVDECNAGDGKEPFLDPYGATNPAEFFAVASETFFEMPGDLKEEHPLLYEQLRDYYGLDPARWQEPLST